MRDKYEPLFTDFEKMEPVEAAIKFVAETNRMFDWYERQHKLNRMCNQRRKLEFLDD